MTQSFEDVQSILAAILDHQGSAKDFMLQIPDRMNDESGVNMAIITDAILERGWFPNGYTQHDGYRIYKYIEADDA